MKKLITWILTLALLLSAAAIPALAEEAKAESPAWQVIEFNGAATTLISEGFGEKFRYQTFSGPGREYSLAGAYLPRKITAMAVNRENGYAQIDVEYNGGRRCVFLEAKYLTMGDVPEVTLNPVSATVNARVTQMYYGPGNQYDIVRQRTKSKYIDMSMAELMKIFNNDVEKIKKALKDTYPHVELAAGTRVKVLYEVNGWVCVETESTVLGKARTWIPADQVTAE